MQTSLTSRSLEDRLVSSAAISAGKEPFILSMTDSATAVLVMFISEGFPLCLPQTFFVGALSASNLFANRI